MSARDVFLKWFFNGVTPKSEEGVTVGNKKYDEFISALSAAGYAVVPVEPTNSMRLAGIGVDDGKGNPVWVGLADGGIDVRAIINSYKAMLTAAKGE